MSIHAARRPCTGLSNTICWRTNVFVSRWVCVCNSFEICQRDSAEADKPEQSLVDLSQFWWPAFRLLNFTFIRSFVLDPNIDETGNQLFKSNSGPSGCCYEYCASGLCSSSCETIFINNHTAITPNNSTNRTQSKVNLTPNLFVRLDDGSYVLNDCSNMPAVSEMVCPALPNITQSTQQCSISQAQAASSVTSLHSTLSSLSSISVLITYLLTCLHIILPLEYIVETLKSHWTILVWNLVSASVLRKVLLRLVTGL